MRYLPQRLEHACVKRLPGNGAAAPLPSLIRLLRKRDVAQRFVGGRLHVEQIEQRAVRLAQQFRNLKRLSRLAPHLHMLDEQFTCVRRQVPQ